MWLCKDNLSKFIKIDLLYKVKDLCKGTQVIIDRLCARCMEWNSLNDKNKNFYYIIN